MMMYETARQSTQRRYEVGGGGRGGGWATIIVFPRQVCPSAPSRNKINFDFLLNIKYYKTIEKIECREAVIAFALYIARQMFNTDKKGEEVYPY